MNRTETEELKVVVQKLEDLQAILKKLDDAKTHLEQEQEDHTKILSHQTDVLERLDATESSIAIAAKAIAGNTAGISNLEKLLQTMHDDMVSAELMAKSFDDACDWLRKIYNAIITIGKIAGVIVIIAAAVALFVSEPVAALLGR